MTTDEITRTLSPDLPQIRARAHHADIARYLSGASLDELAHVTGALAAELGTVRGIPVADLIGGIQARIESQSGARRLMSNQGWTPPGAPVPLPSREQWAGAVVALVSTLVLGLLLLVVGP